MERRRARTRRLLLVALVTMLVAVGLLPVRASASPFPDVPDDAWYAPAATWAKNNGVMSGYQDGRFAPEDELTREQAAGVFYNYLGDGVEGPATSLADVSQSGWYAKAVNWAVDTRAITGYSGGSFGVGDSLTREQLAVIMARVCGVDLTSVDSSKYDALPDHGSTSSWARPSLAWAVQNGVIHGFSGANGTRTLAPQAKVTRAQMAAIMRNAVKGGLLKVDPSHRVNGHEIYMSEPTAGHVAEDGGVRYVDNEVIAIASEGVPEGTVESAVKSLGGSIVGHIDVTGDYQVRFSSARSLASTKVVCEALKVMGIFDDVTPHYVTEVSDDFTPNDSQWASDWGDEYPSGKNWGVEAIDAPGAWNYRKAMKDVKVGVYDGDFDDRQEDLTWARVWHNDGNAARSVHDGHGTHVAGIMAADFNNSKGIAGVAPKATLYGYSRIGTEDSPETDMTLKNGFATLLTAGCRVINCSQSSGSSSKDEEAECNGRFLERFLEHNYDFVIVQAAGNDGVQASNAGYFVNITNKDVRDRIMVIANAERLGFGNYDLASDSNYGNRIDVAAPGTDIWSTMPNNKYDYKSGTSMAAPHVSGVAAMCFAINPSLSGAQVKAIIVKAASESGVTVAPSQAAENGGFLRSYPMLNAKRAVDMAVSERGSGTDSNLFQGIVMGEVSKATDGAEVDEGADLSDVKVDAYRVENGTTKLAQSAKLDSDDSFQLVLEAGMYNVVIHADGYESYSPSGSIRVIAGSVQDLGQIRLDKSSPYESVISAYRSALKSDSEPTSQYVNAEAWSARNAYQGKWAYALYDLNGDGTEELLVGIQESQVSPVDGTTVGYRLYDMYTLVSGKPVRFIEPVYLGYRTICIPCRDARLEIYNSGGAYYRSYDFCRIGSTVTMSPVADYANLAQTDYVDVDHDMYTFERGESGEAATLTGSAGKARLDRITSSHTPITNFPWTKL